MSCDHSFDHPHTPESPFNSTCTEYTTQESSPKNHSLPTPAHSTNGSVSSLGFRMAHNESLSKRKREVDDIGDRKLKKPHIAHGKVCLKDIHTNVSKNYKLCHNPLPPVIPDFSKDLFALYGLESVANSVARTNPDGSKCVKLRKTYKNHIKDHQLCGNFDSVRREVQDPGSLFSLLSMPEEKWKAERPGGEEVEKGLPLAVKNLMSKAFKMSRGTIPKSWNSSMLGDLAIPPASSDPVRTTKMVSSRPLPHNSEVRRTVKSEGPRPKRSVKKRTYGDTSYEGYGEGYVDDGQEADFATGDGDGIRMKRPKKVCSLLYMLCFLANNYKSSPSHGFQGPHARHNSYGPGMVGA